MKHEIDNPLFPFSLLIVGMLLTTPALGGPKCLRVAPEEKESEQEEKEATTEVFNNIERLLAFEQEISQQTVQVASKEPSPEPTEEPDEEPKEEPKEEPLDEDESSGLSPLPQVELGELGLVITGDITDIDDDITTQPIVDTVGGTPGIPEEQKTPAIDDTPTVHESEDIVVDGLGLLSNFFGVPNEEPGAIMTVQGTLEYNFGLNGPGNVSFVLLDGQAVVDASDNALQHDSKVMTYHWENATQTLSASTIDAIDVFTVRITNISGDFEFILFNPIDYPIASEGDAMMIPLLFTVSDADGDSAVGDLSIMMINDANIPIEIPATEIERAYIGSDASDIIESVDPFIDLIFGLAGDDFISSGLGDDIVVGGSGNDLIHSGPGNDAIYGNGGDDIVVSGAGADMISFGDGNDVYKLTAADIGAIPKTDTIFDINIGPLSEDTLDILDTLVGLSDPTDPAEIKNYLVIPLAEPDTILIDITGDDSGIDHTIILSGIDLYALFAAPTLEQLIDDMLTAGALV